MSDVDAVKCLECGAVLRADPAVGQQQGESNLTGEETNPALTCHACGRINRLSELFPAGR